MAKTRTKSSIDNTKVFKALLQLVAAKLDRSITVDDIAAHAGVATKDKAALKQKFKLWSDPTVVIRVKDKETGEVEERENKVLSDRRDFVNFMRSYLAKRNITNETTVAEMCVTAYGRLKPTLVQLGATSERGFKVDDGMLDLMDDFLGDVLFEDEPTNSIDSDDIDEEDLLAVG